MSLRNVPLIRDDRGCIVSACSTTVEPSVYFAGRKYSTAPYPRSDQKRILKTVRLASSDYVNSLVPQTVYDATAPGQLPWNNMSDRAVAGVVHSHVPSRGVSSAHATITRARPGACSAPGSGVDVKHGSYARYLAKLKGKTVGRSCSTASAVPTPIRGDKTQYFSVSHSDRCSYPLVVVG
jgi:hypothetical protein